MYHSYHQVERILTIEVFSAAKTWMPHISSEYLAKPCFAIWAGVTNLVAADV
jgi:hypothetical protein